MMDWCNGKRGFCQHDELCSQCGHFNGEGLVELSESLHAYIRELEARVAELEKPLKPMTWEEAMMDDFFLEIRGDDCIDGALNNFAVDGDEGYMWVSTRNREEDESKLMRSDYGKTWRCWSRRPTEEEREAAKWDE